MNHSLFIILLVTIPFSITTGQKADTIYFNKEDIQVNSKEFFYYRIASQENGVINVSDYFKSGSLKMTGAYKSFDFKDEIGPFYYYKNKKLKQLELNNPTMHPEIYKKFRERLDFIPFLPDTLKLVVIFSANGKVKEAGFVQECCEKFSQWFYFFGDKTIYLITYKGSKRNGPFNVYRNKILVFSSNYKNEMLDGPRQRFDYDGKLIVTEYFSNGKKITK